MRYCTKNWLVLFLLSCFSLGGSLVAQADICAVCGKQIQGQIYIMTDEVTGQKELVCGDCIKLPLCTICGLPIKPGEELQLPDGRYFCARDAKTIVVKTDEAEQVCAGVKDGLDRLFSRFTSFPNNVDVTAIDHIDAYTIFQSESPGLLGCTEPVTTNGLRRYKISLMTGLPLVELKETCAHEYSHTWVGENVPAERHQRLAGDAEEGFCEMIGYLYMDSLHEEAEKKRVLANAYTRGQIDLFIAAEQKYGFDDILDWMRYGTTAKLEAGHLDAIRDVKMPAEKASVAAVDTGGGQSAASGRPLLVTSVSTAPTTFKLQGIMWGGSPSAIINGHTFFVNDVGPVRLSGTNVTIRCMTIQKNFVRIREVASGQEQQLGLP
ncbi:MAG TPA: protein DA1 [Verrucomicrobiae bacterium]|jgi:hypothetical protein